MSYNSNIKTPTRLDTLNVGNSYSFGNNGGMLGASPEPTPKHDNRHDIRSALKIKPKMNSILPVEPQKEYKTNAPSDVPLTEIHASPTLQMLLYFNTFYSFCFFIFHTILLITSFNTYSVVGVIIHIVLLIISAGCECLRLFAGFFGNLHERVPRLAGFLVISCLFSFPILLIYFVIGFKPITLLERATSILSLIFVILEIFVGFITIWRIVKIASRKYNLQFNDDGSVYDELEEGQLYDILQADEVELLERPSTALSDSRELFLGDGSRSQSRSGFHSPTMSRIEPAMLSPMQSTLPGARAPSPLFMSNKDRGERFERLEKSEMRMDRMEQSHRYDFSSRIERRTERVERMERVDRIERIERLDQSGRSDWMGRDDR